MKLSSKLLAQALLDAVEQNPAEVKQICESFIEFLRINRKLVWLPVILRNLEQVADRRFGIKRVKVAASRPLTDRSRRAIERFVRKFAGARQLIIDETIDESLVGGARIQFNDTLVDLSLKSQLTQLTDQS